MCDQQTTNTPNLEKYKIVYQAYENEVKNLWQRSIFLGAFMIMVWSGYGALQLKFIEKCISKFDLYYCASIGLCAILVILSWLWIAMAKGSKFIQEAHEDKIKEYEREYDEKLFCDLDKFEKSKCIVGNFPAFWFPFWAYRFSVGKINIVLGWISLLAAFSLLVVHIKFYGLYGNYAIQFIKNIICQGWFICLTIGVFLVLPLLMYLFIKGGNTIVTLILKCLLWLFGICKFIKVISEKCKS